MPPLNVKMLKVFLRISFKIQNCGYLMKRYCLFQRMVCCVRGFVWCWCSGSHNVYSFFVLLIFSNHISVFHKSILIVFPFPVCCCLRGICMMLVLGCTHCLLPTKRVTDDTESVGGGQSYPKDFYRKENTFPFHSFFHSAA